MCTQQECERDRGRGDKRETEKSGNRDYMLTRDRDINEKEKARDGREGEGRGRKGKLLDVEENYPSKEHK